MTFLCSLLPFFLKASSDFGMQHASGLNNHVVRFMAMWKTWGWNSVFFCLNAVRTCPWQLVQQDGRQVSRQRLQQLCSAQHLSGEQEGGGADLYATCEAQQIE